MLKHFYAIATVMVILSLGAVILNGQGQEKTGQVQQPLVNGQVVSPVFQETYGLLSISSAQPGGGTSTCSATLLTNDWAISAAHCFSPSNLMNPNTVTVTANWTKAAQRQGAQIVSFGTAPNWDPWDIALIRMDFSFILADSAEGFHQLVWLDGPYTNLDSTRIEMLGRGIYRFASGSGASATPSQRDGQYRYGTAMISRVDDHRYWYAGDNGQMIAGGDSGGASYARVFGGRAITGVHSLCTTQCLPGQMCTGNSWTWVMATPECGDAPIQPIWNQIKRTIEATRSPAPPTPPLGPNNPIGTFEDYKPCNPVVFIPAPDAPAHRISQAWGDRGIWDQDRINVRIQESPKGSGLFDVIVREGNPPNAIETSAQQMRISERPTFQYGAPLYAAGVTSVAGSGKIDAPNLGAATPGRPAPSRPPSAAGGAAQQGGIAKSGIGITGADRVKVPYRFDRSLGLSLDKGIRLEVDIQCDERLSPRIYQVRYLRSRDSGEIVVDVMLKFSQSRPR